MSDGRKEIGLSGNALKILAAISMVIDHVGVILFPHTDVFRILGRISFPIFAFMIAEGCAHTKNRLRYFLSIFALGVGCQVLYYVHSREKDMGILITFLLSILLIYALQYLKETWFAPASVAKRCLACLLFVGSVVGVYVLSRRVDIDYGFCGCMAPVWASVMRMPRTLALSKRSVPDWRWMHVLMFSVGLILVAVEKGGLQIYSLFAIPLLLLYSGKRGKWNMKYFFYIFYPAHLVILQGISSWIR